MTFFPTVSHEIRNPLTEWLCVRYLARGSAMSWAQTSDIVNTLKGCADQLRSILDDVLDFTRIETRNDSN